MRDDGASVTKSCTADNCNWDATAGSAGYTVARKKCGSKLFATTLANLDRFQ